MQYIIYLNRLLNKQEIEQIAQSCHPDNCTLIFTQKTFIPQTLMAYPRQQAKLQVQNEQQIFEQCCQDIAHFTHLSTSGGKPIVEAFQFLGNNHWYYLRNNLQFAYRKVMLQAAQVVQNTQAFTVYNAVELWVFHTEPSLQYLLPDVYPNTKVFINHAATANKKSSWNTFRRLGEYLMLFTIRAIIGAFQLIRLKVSSSKQANNVIISSPEYIQSVININNTKKNIKANNYLSYLLEKVKKRKDFIILSDIQPPRLTEVYSRPTKKHFVMPVYGKRALNFDVFTFATLFNPKLWLQFRATKKHLASITLAPNTPAKYRAIFTIAQPTFINVYQGVYRCLAANLMFKWVRIKSIGGTNEHAVSNKPMLDAARKRSIVTYGIQHGLLSAFYRTFHPKDTAYQPIPDHTILWGMHWQQLLLQYQSVYTLANTHVLGHLKTDIIPHLKSSLHPSNLDQRLSDNKKTLLYATQPMVGSERAIRQQLTKDFFQLCKAFPEYQFIIKLHPFDTEESYFHNIARQLGTNNYIIINTDIYRLLAVCDALLVYHSTVGAEAVYFGKPVLVANYNHNDVAGYIASGIGYGFDSYLQLQEQYQTIVQGQLNNHQKAQQQFIQERAYKIDGQTAKRYLQFINNLTNGD